VRLHVHLDQEVAGFPLQGKVALFGHPEIDPRVDTLRYSYRFFSLLILSTTSIAGHAGLEGLTSAVASTTHRLHDRVTELLSLETCTVAESALCFSGPWLHLCPIARTTAIDAGICDRFLAAVDGLHKINLYINLYIKGIKYDVGV
jgi:hypothetical protein